MIIRYLKRFPHALRGLTFASRFDFGFRTQLYGIGLVVAAITFLVYPLTTFEWLFLVLAYLLILITELQNSALEVALDHLHIDKHPAIGKSKDMAAAAVLLAGVFLVIVILTIVLGRF